jgi:hypothetical protein
MKINEILEIFVLYDSRVVAIAFRKGEVLKSTQNFVFLKAAKQRNEEPAVFISLSRRQDQVISRLN